MEAISTLRQMPATKKEQISFSSLILNSVLDGDVPAIEVETFLKSLEEVAKLVRKDSEFKEVLSDELDKYTEKTIDLGNCTITKANRASYQFNEDSEVQQLEAALKSRKEQIKAACKGDIIVIDPNTGEEVQPVTIKHTSYSTIKFK